MGEALLLGGTAAVGKQPRKKSSSLRGVDRPDRRIIESVISYVGACVHVVLRARCRCTPSTSATSLVSSVVAHVSPHVEIEVSLLAKAMTKAGALGSSHIPPGIVATKVDAGQDAWFTVLLGGK
ncbi:hypothetical protein OG21DRAFT_1607225 [Imleria badia]|nr:hypothetical protein OG21DRAFT_1607225 [Imleria badia]